MTDDWMTDGLDEGQMERETGGKTDRTGDWTLDGRGGGDTGCRMGNEQTYIVRMTIKPNRNLEDCRLTT